MEICGRDHGFHWTAILTLGYSFFGGICFFFFCQDIIENFIQREDLNEQTDVSPRKLLISSTCDISVLEDQPIEGSETFETQTVDEMSKMVLYNLCVKTVHKEALKERQPLKWIRRFGPNFPLRDQWRSLYKFPLEKWSGDLQWMIINGAIDTNRFVSHLNPAVRGE